MAYMVRSVVATEPRSDPSRTKRFWLPEEAGGRGWVELMAGGKFGPGESGARKELGDEVLTLVLPEAVGRDGPFGFSRDIPVTINPLSLLAAES